MLKEWEESKKEKTEMLEENFKLKNNCMINDVLWQLISNLILLNLYLYAVDVAFFCIHNHGSFLLENSNNEWD